jgi:hypothetical protein
MEKFKIHRGFGVRQTLLFSAITLTVSACLNEQALVGGSDVSSPASKSFLGCIAANPINTSSIEVSFEWPQGADSVSIMRNGLTVYSSYSGSAGTFLDDGLLEGRTYSYSCSAAFRNSRGKMSTRIGSNLIQASTIAINAPTFDGIGTLTPQGGGSVKVQWNPAQGVPTSKYIIVAKLGSAPVSQDFESNDSATQALIQAGKIVRSEVTQLGINEKILSGLGDELTWYFGVEACSNSGVCTMGDGIDDTKTLTLADTGAPSTQGATQAKIEDSQIKIIAPWQPSQGLVHIRRVFRSMVGGTNIANYINVQNFVVTDAANPPTTLALTSAVNEYTTYYFIVRDEDANGNLNSNTLVQSVNTGDLSPPSGFAGIKASNELESTVQGQVLIKWNAPADWSDYVGFRIYTKNSDNSLNFIKDCTCTANNCVAHPLTQCTVTGLNAYKTYNFHVRAFDASNNLTTYLNPAFSFASKRVIDTTAPTFSSALQVSYTNDVTLSWSAASDNQDSSEAGAIITYQIWRKSNATFASPTNPDAEADGAAPLAVQSTLSYNDATISVGNTYYYTICALDASNNRTCDGNVVFQNVPDLIAPTVSVSNNKTLTGKTWNLTFNINDNATPSAQLQVTVRRKVATAANDFPTTADSPYFTQAGLTTLNNEGNPVIPGTAGVTRYINYLITVSDQAGNVGTATDSVLLDNTPPSSNPTFVSFNPISPNNNNTNPKIIGTASANTATVRLYSNAACTISIGQDNKATFEGSGITLSVNPNTTTNVYAQAETAAATVGNCVLLGTYIHDNIAPTLASLTLGGSSMSVVNNISRPVTWGSLSEAIDSYCIKLSTNPNSETTAGCSWTTSASLPDSVSGTATSDGNYHFVAWVRDGAGNTSARVSSSNSITVDTVSPAWANSLSGPTYTTSSTAISSSVTYTQDAVDPNFSKYQYAVGTAAATNAITCSASCSDMKSWTDVATTSFTITGISGMDHATTYYVSVRALDLAGNYTVYSIPVIVDLLDPAAPNVTSHAENSSITVPVSGTLTYTGTCDSSTGNVTTVTPGTGVVILGTPTCSGGVLTINLGMLGLNSSEGQLRSVDMYTTKPSGRTSATVTRNVLATGVCPPRYVGVAGNATYGTTDFCVAKFEMKAVTSNPTIGSATLANSNGDVGYNASWFPDSRPDGTPFVNINQRQAVLMCDKLNPVANGTGPYQLITNAQWQTMAANIENVAANWSGSNPAVGVGQIARGHTDNAISDLNNNDVDKGISFSGHNALAASSKNNVTVPWNFATNTDEFNAGYRGTGNSPSSGWEQRRTHYLANREVIWDTAGNVWEWVRFTESVGTLDTGIAGNDATHYNSRLLPTQPNIPTNWYELNNTSNYSNTGGTGALLSLWFVTSGIYSPNPSTFNLGRINISQNNTGNVIRRGGFWNNAAGSGIFSTNLGNGPSYSLNQIGFRCAFSP